MRNSTLLIFTALTLFQLLITYYSNTYILTDDMYRLIVGTQMTDRQFDNYLEFVHKWKWVSYLFIPHGIIEITWLTLLTIHSYKIFISFKKSLLTNFKDNTFLEILISFKTLILFTIIIFTALIESFLTPLINNKF